MTNKVARCRIISLFGSVGTSVKIFPRRKESNMKKSTKLVILFLAVALIVGVFMFAISASNNDPVISYVDSSGNTVNTSSISEAMANVKEGESVTLGSRLVIDEPIVISKRVSLDLGGNTIVNTASTPVFDITVENSGASSGSEENADVRICGAGYIETNGMLISHTTNAKVVFEGEEYGMHVTLNTAEVGAVEITDGELSFSLVEIELSVSGFAKNIIDAKGGILYGDKFGIVCDSDGSDKAYAYRISGEALVMLDNSYVNTSTNTFFIDDGTSGVDMTEIYPEGYEPDWSDGSAAPGQSGMPVATIDEKIVSFYENDMAHLVVNGGYFMHTPAKTAYNQAFLRVPEIIEDGISGLAVFADSDIITSSILVDTGFGAKVLDEELYINFAVVLSSSRITVANYGRAGGGYLFKGRAPVKLIDETTVEMGTIPFTSSAMTSYSGGTPLVYVEAGTRFDNKVENHKVDENDIFGTRAYSSYTDHTTVYDPFGPAQTPYVMMDTYTVEQSGGQGGEAVTLYRDAEYEKIAKFTENLGAVKLIDMEAVLRGSFTNASPSSFGYRINNCGGRQIYLEYTDDNAYFTYYTPSPDDVIVVPSAASNNQYFFDEQTGLGWYTGSGGSVSASFEDTERSDLANGCVVTVTELNFAAPENGFSGFTFCTMSYTSGHSSGPNYGSTFTVMTSGATSGGGVAYTDGRWNKLIIVVQIKPHDSNADMVSYQATYYLNPGTDDELVYTGSITNAYRVTGEIRIQDSFGEGSKAPFGSGLILDDVCCTLYEKVDAQTYNAQDYVRLGEGTKTSGFARQSKIRVNGRQMRTLDEAFKYANEIGSYVTVDGNIIENQAISASTPDGYMLVKGNYSVLFDSEKPAKYYPDCIGDGTGAFFFSNTVYGSGLPVGTNWYFGSEEKVLHDLDNLKTSMALRGTYPKQPDGNVPPIVIGDRFYTFAGWVANEYVWYGNYETPAEYDAAIASLDVGIKGISYEDLIYGYGPTYYPVYKDSGIPAFVITAPGELSIGEVKSNAFASYVKKLGSGDTLTFNEDFAADFGETLFLEGTENSPIVVNIDLAGSKVDLTSTSTLIKLGSYVTLNVYSSLPGAKLNVLSSTYATYAFEIASGAEEAIVNLGAFGSYPGANLEISAAGIVLADGAASSKVNVNGGIYNKYEPDDSLKTGLFAGENDMGAITVDGAVVIAVAGDSKFFTFYADVARQAYNGDNFVIKNSMLIAASKTHTVMDVDRYYRLRIEETVLLGRLGNTADKVIVGKGTSYVSLHGTTTNIAEHTQANISTTNNRKAIVYAETGIMVAGFKMPPEMFSYYNGSAFENTAYVTVNQEGNTVCVLPEGADASIYNADVVIYLSDIDYKVVESTAQVVEVYWLTLEHDKEKYADTEKYLSTSVPKYRGEELEAYSVNDYVKRVHTGEWTQDMSEYANGKIFMYPKFQLEAKVQGMKTELDLSDGIKANLLIPEEYYDVLSQQTKAALTHAIKTVGSVDYYYITGLDATNDQALIAELVALGAVESGGEYLIPAAKYSGLPTRIKAYLAPEKVVDGSSEYLIISQTVDIRSAVTGTSIKIVIESGGQSTEHVESVISLKDYLISEVAAAKSASNTARLKLLSYIVDYIDKAYEYYKIFETVDDYDYDFSSIINVNQYISSGDFTLPTYTPSDVSGLSGVVDVTVDISSMPKFTLTISNPNFDGIIEIDGVKYTVEDAQKIRGRYVFVYDTLAFDKFDKVFTVKVDADKDGIYESEGAYSLGDFIKEKENSFVYLKDMLASFRSYVCYFRAYKAAQG